MSEIVTDRLPTEADADAGLSVLCWDSVAWELVDWDQVKVGDLWQRCPPPPQPPAPDTSLAASIERQAGRTRQLCCKKEPCDCSMCDRDRIEDAARKWDASPKYSPDETLSLQTLITERDEARARAAELEEKARKWDERLEHFTETGERLDRLFIDDTPDPGPHHELCDLADAEQSWNGDEWEDPHGGFAWHRKRKPLAPDGERREWLASIWTDINGEQAHLYSDAENASSWAKSSLVRIREVLPTDPTPDEVEQLRRERDELRERCKEVVSTGRAGFVVSESCGSAKHYVVTAKFTTLEEAQAFYRSRHGLARAVEANELRGEESTNES